MSKSPRGKGAQKVQHSDQINEDYDGTTDDDDANYQNDASRSYTSANESYMNISARSDLGHRSDANANSSSGTYKRSSKLNTSTSSNSDGTEGAAGRHTSRSPIKLIYPSLDELKSEKTVKVTVRKEDNIQNTSRIAEKSEHPKSPSYNSLVMSLLICVSCICCAGLWYYLTLKPAPVDNSLVSPSPFDRFKSHITALEQNLPSQNERLWRTVKSSTKHVLHSGNSNYPVVILMASPFHLVDISRCISQKITGHFEEAQDLSPVEYTVDISSLRDFDPANQKQRLDEYLHSAFSKSQTKSVIIENLQQLHPEAALLLHGYCDNDNAPYKDVMMVLLLHIDEKHVDFTDGAIENYLEELWSRGLEVDKVKALLSRVANNIVTVKAEDAETFQRVCS